MNVTMLKEFFDISKDSRDIFQELKIMESLQPDFRPHVIIELKQGEDIEKLKQEALEQILEKKYHAKLKGKVLCVGLALNKKKCELTYKEIEITES